MFHHSCDPRPEYPRPEKQRGLVEGLDWLNLNGPWQFRFDGERRGMEEKWFEPQVEGWREQIIVPFCWESLAAWGEASAASSVNYYATRVFRNPLEVTRANHRTAARYEIGWYRREIAFPREWLDRRIILHIGASDFFTDAWCNGIPLGHHEGGYTPFEFDLTEALAGSNRAVLVVRVEDPLENSEQPLGKQWKWYTPTSGIWQTVFLEPRAPAFVSHFRITPDVDHSSAGFEIVCTNTGDGLPLEIDVEITPPGGHPIAQTFQVHSGLASGTVRIDPLVLWEPASPQLYSTVLRLRGRDGAPDDVVRTYFGMRTIGTAPVEELNAPAALCLNGRPIYLRGALYQSYHPDGVYTAGDAQALRNDIAWAKEAGFDFLRIHIKLDDPLLLYYADTMGILLMEDFPNFGEGGDTPLGRRRFETMMRVGMERDWNHPSLIAWCLFNETWGFGGQVELIKHFGANAHALLAEPQASQPQNKLENRSSQRWVQEMWELAKSLDPTRLVEDMSVVHWEHLHYYAHGDTDINSWHFYINDYEKARTHIGRVVAETYKGSKFNYEEGYSQGHQPLINSEFGGIGALDGDVDISWSFKFLTNELRRQPSLSAYIYTELHDVEWEYNGFLNYDRTPKQFGYDPRMVNQGDVLPIDAPPIQRCAPGERKRIEVFASHYSRHECGPVSFFWKLSGIDARGRIIQSYAGGHKRIPFRHCRVDLAETVEFALPETQSLCALDVRAVADNGRIVASNYVQLFVTPDDLLVREEIPEGIVIRADIAAWNRAEWSGTWSSPDEARQTGQCHGFGNGFFEWNLDLRPDELACAKR
ncbi:MAG: glycoside hydrolase family 2, partial [Verrucomicrobia bacterium]|nr:glycoside hydrolase family 2 [Verrucomicrobiota bacterium]